MPQILDGGADPRVNQAAQEAARRQAEETARRIAEENARREAEAAAAAARQAEAEAVRKAAADAVAQQAQDSQRNTGRLQAGAQADPGALPWAAQDRANRPEAAKRLETGVSLDDMKKDPKLASEVAALKDSKDPVVRAELDAASKSWNKQIIDDHVRAGAGRDPKAVFEGIATEIKSSAQATGLGEVLHGTAAQALNERAIDTLARKPTVQELHDNPAVGQMLGVLQDSSDPRVKGQLKDLVKGYAQASIDRNLQGKQKESGVNQAVDATTRELLDLATKTGLGPTVKEASSEAFKESKHKFEDTANRGKSAWDTFCDGVSGLVGDGMNVLGKGLDALGSVTNHAVGALGELSKAEAGLAGSALDTVGAHGLAADTRALGNEANRDAQTAGHALDDALNTAGRVVAGGPLGLVNAAADQAIGPEKPEYKQQIDGYTGAIANRLGKGDAVYIQGQAGAQVGVGAFAGGQLSGGATLARGSDGKLTLSLSVGGSAEAGVSAETGVKSNVDAGGLSTSVGAKATASASVNAAAQGKLALTFDPSNPADVNRLKALIEPTPAKILASAANPLAAVAVTAGPLEDAIHHNFASAETAASTGASASAEAAATLGPLGAKADVGADGVAGVSKKFKADGSTEERIFLAGGVHAGASANALGVGAGVRADLKGLTSVTVTKDAAGQVIGVSGEQAGGASVTVGTKAERKSTGSGGAIDKSKVGGGAGSNDVTADQKTLTPDGVRQYQEAVKGGASPLAAYGDVAGRPGCSTDQVSHTHTDEVSLGFSLDGHVLGVGGSVNAKVTLGKSHTDISGTGASGIPDDRLNRNISHLLG